MHAATTTPKPRAGGAPELAPEGGDVRDRRGDVEGLRAVAVMMVVLYHAGVGFFPGGFVGVDVFFVISGFLITGLILREESRTGRISLLGFYARRAKRLLPASAVVVLSIAGLSFVLLPKTRWPTIAHDIVASSLYSVNWTMAERSVDYLAASAAPSPLQHFWSLAIEEQFYLLWPALLSGALVVTAKLSTRRPSIRMWGPLAVTATLTTMSLLFSIYYTSVSPERAYFVTPTRVWEMGLGALLAILSSRTLPIGRPTAAILGWFGLLLVVGSAMRISSVTPFPGFAAALPTLGTLLVIGCYRYAGELGPVRLLRIRSFTWIGGLSYSIYLWHWPALVFAQFLWPDASVLGKFAVAALSFVPAWLTFRYVEDPIRRALWLARPPARGIAIGLACMAAGVLAGFALAAPVNESADAVDESSPSVDQFHAPVLKDGMGAEALSRASDAGKSVRTASFVPDPVAAQADVPDAMRPECLLGTTESQPRICSYGDPRGATEVAVVGDSHAAQMMPALDAIARRNGWHVSAYLKGSCPFADVDVLLEGGPFDTCRAWTRLVTAELVEQVPRFVITTSSGYAPANPEDTMADGFRDTWKALTNAGIHVVPIRETPTPQMDIPECVASHPEDLSQCDVARAQAVLRPSPAVQAASGLEGVTMVDLNPWICPQRKCVPVIGGILVYRDASHLTGTYAKTLARELGRQLLAAGLPGQ